MLGNEELQKFIIQKCKEMDVKPYELAQNIDLSEMGAYNILHEISKNPRRKSLLMILEYLEKKTLGSELSTVLKEEESTYQKPDRIIDEEMESILKKVTVQEIFTDVGTELLLAYRKQIIVHELNVELFKKNANLMEEKITYLTAQH